MLADRVDVFGGEVRETCSSLDLLARDLLRLFSVKDCVEQTVTGVRVLRGLTSHALREVCWRQAVTADVIGVALVVGDDGISNVSKTLKGSGLPTLDLVAERIKLLARPGVVRGDDPGAVAVRVEQLEPHVRGLEVRRASPATPP